MNFKQILEGWRNNTLPPSHLKDLIRITGEKRINICLDCAYHSRFHKTMRPDAHCTNCGCTLAAKTKCLSCECPIGKWKAIVSGDQEEQIKNMINEKERSDQTS